MVNVAVLTTGFDYPKTDCIILARPTKSRILYEQIIGRGLRTAENKKDCLIIDINDVVKHHDLMSLSNVFDMDIKHGETPKEAQKRIKREKEDEEERLREEELRKQKEIEIRAKQIKLFNRDFENGMLGAKYDWFKVDISTYALSFASDKHYVIEKYDENETTKYILYESHTNKENKELNFIKEQYNLKSLIEYVEYNLIWKVNSFIDINGEWKTEAATENQRKYVHNAETKWDCHKHFASYYIKTLLNNRGA